MSTKVSLSVIANAKTRLPRALLPADDRGQFTGGDNVPKKGTEYGSHDVHRKLRVVRELKSGIFGYLPRKGEIYRSQWDAEAGKWVALERLEGKAKENAQALIDKEMAAIKTAKAEAKAAEKAAAEAQPAEAS